MAGLDCSRIYVTRGVAFIIQFKIQDDRTSTNGPGAHRDARRLPIRPVSIPICLIARYNYQNLPLAPSVANLKSLHAGVSEPWPRHEARGPSM